MCRTLFRPRCALILTLPLSLSIVTGCRSTPPPPPAATALPSASRYAQLSDDALVHTSQRDGLGLGLRGPASPIRANTQIPLHLLFEDFAARTPIASGLCAGLSLSYEETSTHDSSTGDFTNPRCFDTLPNPDEIPLQKGQLKILDATQRNFSNLQLAPGTYQITATWNAFPAGKGTIIERPVYTTLLSNPIQITILP